MSNHHDIENEIALTYPPDIGPIAPHHARRHPISHSGEALHGARHGAYGAVPVSEAEIVVVQRPNGTVSPITFRVSTVLRPGQGCQACLAMNPPDTWLHLRENLGDGFVGCCDNSPNRHSTRHAAETGLPLVTSVEPGETWVYDYLTGEKLSD